jgi:hypothetical protein
MTGYGLEVGGAGVRAPVGSGVSLLNIEYMGTEDDLATYPVGTGVKTAKA